MNFLLPVCTGVAPRSFYQDFADGIERSLAELGHRCERFEFAAIGEASPQEASRLFAWSRGVRCHAVIDLCCWAWRLSQVRLWRGEEVGETVFDSIEAACVPLLLDQPYFQALPGIHSRALAIAYPDRHFPAIIAAIYPSVRGRAAAFVPPATSLANDRSSARWRDKSIELLYVGNLNPAVVEPFWAHVPAARAYDAAAELALGRTPRPLHECAAQALRETGIELEPEGRIEMLRTLEYFLRQRLRHRLVSAVAATGIPMRIHGAGWDAAGLPASVTIRPATDYPGFMELLGSARICLDASTYLGGANDRIFHCAVNRAAFFTNAGGYPAEVFGEASGAFSYSFDSLSELGERIRALLERPEELAARGERSRQIALAGHLWRHRAQTIVQLVEQARGSAGRAEH